MSNPASNRSVTVADISEWTAHRLASEAGCASPDNPQSPGATFLRSVRDDILERLEDVSNDDLESFHDGDQLHEIADSAPSIYTFTKWQEFTDLAAWQEDVTDDGPIEDLESAAHTALYMIAERLANVILDAVVEAAELDTENENDADTDDSEI